MMANGSTETCPALNASRGRNPLALMRLVARTTAPTDEMGKPGLLLTARALFAKAVSGCDVQRVNGLKTMSLRISSVAKRSTCKTKMRIVRATSSTPQFSAAFLIALRFGVLSRRLAAV